MNRDQIKVFLWSALLAFALLVVLRSAALPPHSSACGEERWSVKTLADPNAAQVLARSPLPASVNQLRALPAPGSWSPQMPRQEAETRVYQLNVWLLGYKMEADQDYHVVISDPGDKDHTMIAEVPSPSCAKTYGDNFSTSRAVLNGLHKPAAKGKMVWFKQPVRAQLFGVLFFDKLHGQTGVAPNGVEIHPVMSINVEK